MLISYEEWCKNHTDISQLASSLKSSLPEQYIGFYLRKAFGNEVEYQKQFDWLGRLSLDFYIPSLQLAIEYDGNYHHKNKQPSDNRKTSLCTNHGIYLIRIKEVKPSREEKQENNTVFYCFNARYKNIDIAIQDLCSLINKKFGIPIQIDVDMNRDNSEIVSYVQEKYHKKTIAHIWPESEHYWVDEIPESIHDIFYTTKESFPLRCPHCKKSFTLYTRYCHDRKSLVPCPCEYSEIELALQKAIKEYKETGALVVFDDSLDSRRLYDEMAKHVKHRHILEDPSKEEIEMYKKLGFDTPLLDEFLLAWG